jgi:tetrahydromethanopterin S-methyltransferase subunit E
MNHQAPDSWQELARIWKTGDAPVTVGDIEALHVRQHRKLRLARGGELACSALGVVAALWLAVVSPFLWVGIVTVAVSIASACMVLRARRVPVPQGSTDLLESLKDSLTYLDWLAEQLRYGRILGFVALFAVVIAASAQLMRFASATPVALLATTAAGIAIGASLAWNMTLAWQVWRRTARLQIFEVKLVTERDSPSPLS